jgi:hypothetical protein
VALADQAVSGMVQCCGCTETAQGAVDNAVPPGWDALCCWNGATRRNAWQYFCAACARGAAMEMVRAAAGLPHREDWRFPAGIAALYLPARQAVMLAMDGHSAVIPEDEAERLFQTIGNALAVRDQARAMMETKG